MKRSLFRVFSLAALLTVPLGYALGPALAQQQQRQQSANASAPATAAGAGAPATPDGNRVDVEGIIRAFSAKEATFQQALTQYGFKRDAVIQVIGMGGQIAGEYRRVSRFVMDDTGRRFEKILFFPMPTISQGGLEVTPADLEDLGGVNAFALEASKIDKYKFTYAGKERIDELNLYVFDVAPKVMPDPKKSKERLFQGRIWVDDQDLQIVKVRGKGVPEGKERFPTFETYREQIEGRYWFPTYSYADDELIFDSGQAVHIRMRVRYTDFERLTGKVRVIEEGEPDEKEPPVKPEKP